MRATSKGWIALALMICGCGMTDENCVSPPCALPLAVTVHLTSAATGDSIQGATLRVTGPMEGSGPCSGSVCSVFGPAGTYSLTVEAPGFQTAQRTVTVRGAAPERCGCGTTFAEQIDLALAPSA